MTFTVETLSPRLMRIRCPGRVFAYLVLGDEKAMLIDTGLGCGDLSAFVKTLTDLPVTVFLTHGHLDHAGGLIGFSEIWLHPADRALLESDSLDARYEYTRGSLSPGEHVEKSDFQPGYKGPTHDLLPGRVFDLGGASVEALSLPGHTDGMLAAYILPDRALLLGDGLNSATFLFLGSGTVSEYRAALEALLPVAEKADLALYSHPHNYGGTEIVAEGIAACDAILAGRDDRIELPMGEARGTKIFASHRQTPDGARNADGTAANLFYRPEQAR